MRKSGRSGGARRGVCEMPADARRSLSRATWAAGAFASCAGGAFSKAFSRADTGGKRAGGHIPAAIICGSRRRGRTKSRRAARRICAPECCAPKLPGFFPVLSWGRLSEAPVSSGCGGESGQRAEPVLRAFPDFFPAGRCAPLTGIFRGLRFRIFRRIPADPPAAERAASARGRRPRSPPRPRAAPAALSAELPPFRA